MTEIIPSSCVLSVTAATTVIAEAETTSDNPPKLDCSQVAGNVMTFGQGDCGQLGLGEDMTERKKPYPVTGALEGLKIFQVVCGGMHTAVLTNDGKVTTHSLLPCR